MKYKAKWTQIKNNTNSKPLLEEGQNAIITCRWCINNNNWRQRRRTNQHIVILRKFDDAVKYGVERFRFALLMHRIESSAMRANERNRFKRRFINSKDTIDRLYGFCVCGLVWPNGMAWHKVNKSTTEYAHENLSVNCNETNEWMNE